MVRFADGYGPLLNAHPNETTLFPSPSLFIAREVAPEYGDPFRGLNVGSEVREPADDSDSGTGASDAGTAAPEPGSVAAPFDTGNAAPGRASLNDVDFECTDPFTDADALEELEEEITTLAAHIHAATHRLLVLIAEFDRRRGWELGGHRSCAHWLHFRTGIDLGAAREKVRAARALKSLPRTSAAMARGELSFSKIRALTRVADETNETELLELARGCTTADLERVIRAFRRGSTEDEASLERGRHQRRSLSVFPDDDGMYMIRGRLPAEIGALLMRALEAATHALYREEGGRGKASGDDPTHDPSAERFRDTEKTGARPSGAEPSLPPAPPEAEVSRAEAARRRADALGLLAERALAAGLEDGPVSGTRAARYQVMLHVEPETLESEDGISRFKRELLAWDERVRPSMERGENGPGSAPGGGKSVSAEPLFLGNGRSHCPHPPDETSAAINPRSNLEDGTRLSAETSRRISCDCGVVPVHHRRDGSILNVGRKTRSIPPSLRRALEVRDQGCRFPGCGLRFTDAHHVKHWGDGGETSLDNCLLLCAHHHRLVHEGGWKVDWWGRGRPVFMDPRGRVHFDGRWQPPKGVRTCGGLPEANHGPGSRPSWQPGQEPIAGREPDPGRAPDLAKALMQENLRHGIEPDAWTAAARWKRETDIPGEVRYPAEEALC